MHVNRTTLLMIQSGMLARLAVQDAYKVICTRPTEMAHSQIGNHAGGRGLDFAMSTFIVQVWMSDMGATAQPRVYRVCAQSCVTK